MAGARGSSQEPRGGVGFLRGRALERLGVEREGLKGVGGGGGGVCVCDVPEMEIDRTTEQQSHLINFICGQ